MMKNAFADKVFNFTAEKGLFSAPCHVLLGLSGGADSMALLHLLTHWKTPSLQVSAIHIHHGLRGNAADQDEAFVREYCVRYDVPITVVHSNVAAIAENEHLTLEEAGRRVRYEQFEMIRDVLGADYVVTAHTADDQAETVLMHLIRGCGIDGLAGIPAIRGNIRRPLLCCTRAEIEEYCAVNAIPYVTDETNADIRYTRNDVRHRVLPLLKDINPAIGNALLRLSKHAADDADYLNHQAMEALESARVDYGYSVKKMATLPLVMRRRMIRLMLRDIEVPSIEETHILAADEVILRQEGAVSLPDGYTFAIEQGVVCVRKSDYVDLPASVIVETLPATVDFRAFRCALSLLSDEANVHNLFLQSIVDHDKIVGKLCLRCRQVGDYLHPSGRGVGKSLKKLMNEWHIPAHLRDTYPLLCDDAGVVLVPGYACDERVKVTDATKHYLVCEISKV